MSSFTAVDLSRLPFPAIVEPLDFETILAALVADLIARDPSFTALVESDPAYKILEIVAYRELLIRQRVNEAAKAIMLAYALGSDLDQLAANVNVQRLVIDPGDAAAIPPVPPTLEADADLRRRVQLAFEGLSVAGPTGAYVFHALGADADVADVSVVSDSPGVVDVYVLARNATGIPSAATLAAVAATLSADSVRPLTDQVQAYPITVLTYTVEAVLEVFDGPDAAVIAASAVAAVTAYLAQQRRIGIPATRSALFAALHQPGVRNVSLLQPAADVTVTDRQVAIGTLSTITVAA